MESLLNIGSIYFILIIIALLSTAALTVFIERLWYLKKSERDTSRLLSKIRESLHLGNIAEAAGICEETGGPVAKILRASIGKHAKSRQQIENAIEIAGMIEIAGLEKNAKVLSVVAHIAPLIGLLGTVLGFIQAFSEMRLSGLVDISATGLGEAMELALITTAAGLAVAIPCVIAYNYIISRIASFVLEMEACSNEIVDILLEARGE
jgi:biopolymer transport protein ExbB